MRNVKAKVKINIPVMAVIAVILIGIIISVIVIVNTNNNQQQLYSFGKRVANGIDVSEHNGEIDWKEISKSQDFAFIRVGYRGYGNGEIIEDKYARIKAKS